MSEGSVPAAVSAPRDGKTEPVGPLPLFRVMLDFDGTLVQPNVAILLVEEFALDGKTVAHEIDQLLHTGRIGLREAWEREVALLPVDRLSDMARFVRERVPLRSGALDFLRFARDRRLDVAILSGGLDFFIREVLDREQIALPVYSDQLVVPPSGAPRVAYPYGHPTCRQCGICKAALVLDHASAQRTVLIADGSTDRYGAEVADIIFARHRLLQYCRTAALPCLPFEDFAPVTEQFRRWLDGAEPIPPARLRGLASSACPISRGLSGTVDLPPVS